MGTKIVFSGYFGANNAGDEAILAAFLDRFSLEIKDFHPVVISADPEKTARTYGVKAVNKTDLRSIIKELKNASLLISGGGSLLQDVTGKKTIPYYLGVIAMAKLMNIPAFFCAQGVGPIKSGFYQKITKIILNKTDTISVRDAESKNFLEKIGVKKEIHLTGDVGYLLNQTSKAKVEKIMEVELGYREGTERNTPYLGISIRPWRDNSYLEYLTQIIVEFNKTYSEYEILFIPMKYPDDYDLSVEAASKAKEKGVKTHVLKGRYLPTEVFGIISYMDLILGIRLHSLVFAAMGETLPLGISYDPKIPAFLSQMNLEPVGSIENLDPFTCMSNIQNYVNLKPGIEENLNSIQHEYKKRAKENINLAMELLEAYHES